MLNRNVLCRHFGFHKMKKKQMRSIPEDVIKRQIEQQGERTKTKQQTEMYIQSIDQVIVRLPVLIVFFL